MTADSTLLKEYAQSGSEGVFAELVRRHLDFVYSIALRELAGDSEAAKDVSQSVFVDLAKKAGGLRHRPTLTGWLYTSTCYAAAKAIRSECRRRTREQKAFTMQASTTEASREADWEQIAPVLSSALLELREADREALLLRFFERRSLAAVGGELGLNENGARMRVERALERLRVRLKRRGITSTASALALSLTHQAVSAAPVGLAASITAASLAGATSSSALSILNLILMSKAKTIGIGAAIATGALTPLVVQHQTNARLRSEIAMLRAQTVAVPVAPVASADLAELERLRSEHEELIRLRGQVTQLRQQLAQQPRVQSDSTKGERASVSSKGGLPLEKDNAKALLAKSPEIPMIPANSWVNAGHATPLAALQTLNWATLNRDTNALLDAVGLESEVRELADSTFARLPEAIQQKYRSVDELLLDWRINLGPTLDSYRVLSQTEQGPGEQTIAVQFAYADGTVRENELRFYRDETGAWRHAIPQQAMQKLPHIVNALADTPATTDK